MKLNHGQLLMAVTLFAFGGGIYADGAIAAPVVGGEAVAPFPAVAESSEGTTASSVALRMGYRFLSPAGTAAKAAPYSLLDPGVVGGVAASAGSGDFRGTLAATVVGADDYHAEASISLGGLYRLHIEREALRHNLTGESLPPDAAGVYRSRENGPVDYALHSTTSQLAGRARLGGLPIHLELGYWQHSRNGTEQLRFSDHFFSDAGSSVVSEARRVDDTAREGQLGIDAQLGPIGLAYDLRIRDFVSDAPISRYLYAVTAGGALTPGSQAHDTTPGSRVVSHTVRAYSDMSGGLTAAASYNVTARENTGSGSDARPSTFPSDSLKSVAGDVSYTPFRELTLALKYRHIDIDRETPAIVSNPFLATPDAGVATATSGAILVRPAATSSRDRINATAVYRFSPQGSVRLEYRAELETRERLPDPLVPASATATGSDSRQTHGATATFSWRPHNGIRLLASYGVSSCDAPATSASFAERHDGRLSVAYTSRGSWGAIVGFRMLQESGDSTLLTYRLPRENRSSTTSASFWVSPFAPLTLSTSYTYMQNTIDQSLVLAGNPAPGNDPVVPARYLSDSHIYGVDAVYAIGKQLDLMLSFQQIFANSLFSVPERGYSLASDLSTSPSDTTGISGLSRAMSAETGTSVRLDWHASRLLDVLLNYSYRMWREASASGDGSLHTTILSFTGRW